jgi:hypothetical protein
MSRKPKPPCPAERWEHDARQWKACAMRLAKLCADLIGCCFDEERTCPEGGQCATCWLNRAVRETAGKDVSNG